MESAGFLHYFLSVAIPFYPVWRILQRAGLNKLSAFLLFIPGLGFLVILIYLAFADWSVLNKNTQR